MDRKEMIRRIVEEGASIDQVVNEHLQLEEFSSRKTLVEKSMDRSDPEGAAHAYSTYNAQVQKSEDRAVADARAAREVILNTFEATVRQSIHKDAGKHSVNELEVDTWEKHPEWVEALRKAERTIDSHGRV
jgi:hypothetical protein